jgi:hypothetical protein
LKETLDDKIAMPPSRSHLAFGDESVEALQHARDLFR